MKARNLIARLGRVKRLLGLDTAKEGGDEPINWRETGMTTAGIEELVAVCRQEERGEISRGEADFRKRDIVRREGTPRKPGGRLPWSSLAALEQILGEAPEGAR